MELYSCDTMVALGNSTRSGNVIFAKNSDRPLTEPQPLVIYEAADYPQGSRVHCTYIETEQVEHTYRVMGSKPYWLWGFEHGMNEHGVIIGNEAVWSREPEETTHGLLGMDLLRLGLERGKTAYEAMHVIIALLERHGQGGSAAEGGDMRYHNAFIIADRQEAWVLETVNRLWVARRVTDVAGISNCYTTQEHWDESSDNVQEFAYEKGWATPNTPFNFAKVYGAMSLKHRAAHCRLNRLEQLLNRDKGNITVDSMKAILRDHYEGELIAPRWSPADGLQVSVCMHSLDLNSSKTAAAVVAELKEGAVPWWGCFSNPCISTFVPVFLDGKLPTCYSTAGPKYSNDSMWWQMERLCYAVELNYNRYIEWIRPLQQELEQTFATAALAAEANPAARTTITTACGHQLAEVVDKLYNQIVQDVDQNKLVEPQHLETVQKARLRAGIQ